MDENENIFHIQELIPEAIENKNQEKFYRIISLTNSHKIFPIDICSPSVFKAIINALYIEISEINNRLIKIYFASFS